MGAWQVDLCKNGGMVPRRQLRRPCIGIDAPTFGQRKLLGLARRRLGRVLRVRDGADDHTLIAALTATERGH